MDLDGSVLADGVDFFVGLALHVDAVEGHREQVGEGGSDGVFVGAELGAFADDGGVEVGGSVAGGVDAGEGFGEKDARVLRVVAGVGVGEELADVGLGDGAEEGVGDGVEEGVAVGVGDGAPVVVDLDGAEDEGAPLALRGLGLEAVEVVAVPDPDGWLGGGLGPIGVGRCSHRAILPITGDVDGAWDPGGVISSRMPGPSRTEIWMMSGSRTMDRMGRVLAGVLAIGSVLALCGCMFAGLKPGGAQRSVDEFTYVSTPWEPLTVTLYDRRDDTPLWTVDVPIGSKVSVRFYADKETSGSVRMPDIMRWEIFDQDKSYRRLANAMAVPDANSRLLRVSLRDDVPSYPDEEPGEIELRDPDREWAPVKPRNFRGVPTGNDGNYYRADD